MFYMLILSSLLLLFQGCSAVMAMNGTERPDLSLVQIGNHRSIVESQPLRPIRTVSLENGNISSTYQYTVGNEPSYGRAAVYVLLDVVTFFISELITMPIEAGRVGENRFIQIEYTPEGVIEKIS